MLCRGQALPRGKVVTVGRLERTHGTVPSGASAALRAPRLAGSMRPTASAGMTYSTLSRQAKTTKVAYAPNAARATIHQICQISANPMKVAKKAQMNPVGLFLGISIAV